MASIPTPEIKQLLTRYAGGDTLTEAETWQLAQWLQGATAESFSDEAGNIHSLQDISPRIESSLETKLDAATQKETETPVHSIHRVRFIKRFKWVAAAVILFAFAGGAWLWVTQNTKQSTQTSANIYKNDVRPVTTRATLTLDDGKQIVLDSKQNGLLAQENNTAINNTNGALEYSGNGDGKVHYNTLTTLKGEQFSLKLLDGSYLFIDAATTVRYPTAFIGKERTVEIINGRVWFEVAKNPNQPFFAVKGDQKVRVLGTHFDVSAYDNEASMKVTLVEGSVQVISGNNTGMLKPGQQAVLSKTGNQIKLIEDADVEQAIAWKNGKISFHNADIGAILREIERLYDVEIETKGELPKRSLYFDDVPRTATLAELLHVFDVNKLNYTIDGEKRKLTILP